MVNMRHPQSRGLQLGGRLRPFIRSGNMRRAEQSVDEFIKWVDENQGEKFFAWLHLVDVHTPYRPPPPMTDSTMMETSAIQKTILWRVFGIRSPCICPTTPYFRTWLAGIRDLDWVIAQYQGAITYVDDQIGRLMDAPDAREYLIRPRWL